MLKYVLKYNKYTMINIKKRIIEEIIKEIINLIQFIYEKMY